MEFITSETSNKSYILTVSERTPLINGFRHIKEYLTQYHNMLLHDSYNKLRKKRRRCIYSENGRICANIFRFREKATELLEFDNGIGTRRKSQRKQYYVYQVRPLNRKRTMTSKLNH